MKKHILTLLLAVAMVFSVMAVATSAEGAPVEVYTYAELLEALKTDNANIILMDDITGEAGRGGYSKAGISLSAGDVLDGNNHRLTITGANDTWDCVIAMTGGEVKNLTIAGAMRGVFMPGANGDVVIDNCVFEDVIYTFNSDAGNKNYSVTIKNSALNGWTSFSDVHKSVTFENCTFGEGNGYAYCRPYQATTFVGCDFEEGFEFDNQRTAAEGLQFNGCTYNDDPLSSDNNDMFYAGGNVVIDGTVADVTHYVAKIGGTGYLSLEQALKALQAGDTLTLLDDVTISDNWDCRYNGAKILVPVIIDGNNHTLKLTGAVDDKNWNTVFRFEADATVRNLTIDVSEATSVQRGISSKLSITVDNCEFIGNGTTSKRAIIFGEGAGAGNIANVTATVTNSNFINWALAISDNQNAQDAKSVTITGNTMTNASVIVSASETLTFTGNTVEDGYVNISSYSVPNVLSVTATGNTLDADAGDDNVIKAATIVADEEFVTPVATINGKYYTSLQKAIDACVAGDNTITLLADCEDDVIVKQVAGVNVVIDGNDKKFSGTITIYGNARYTGAETLTIKNVDFVTSDGSTNHYFINSNSTGSVERYAHNLTVTNCTFTAEGEAVHKAVGMRIRQGFNINVSDCEVVNMHSLMQLYGNKGVSVTNTTITGCAESISLGSSTSVVIDGCTIDAVGYGIRADGEGAYDATITNTTITAEKPVVVRRATGNYTLTIGAGNNFTGTNENGYTVIFTNVNDSEALQKPTGAYTVQGEGLAKEKVYPSGVGEIVRAYVRADGSRIMVDMANVNFYKSVELNLYSGSELLTTATLNSAEYPYGRFAELTGSFYITDIGDTWPNTPWTAHDIVVPDRVELVVDGEVADVWNGILNSKYEDLTAEEWAGLATTTECVYGGMCWNSYYHWRECHTCDDVIRLSAHSWTEAGVIKQATETETGLLRYVCTCGAYKDTVIPVLGHEHVAGEEWKHDDIAHWNECECGTEMNVAAHTWNDGVVEGEKLVYTCTVCGAKTEKEAPHTHVAGTEFKYNDEIHWNECSCGEKLNEGNHLWVTDKVENGTIYSKCVLCEATAETPEQTDSYDDESVSYLLPALAISVITVAFAAVMAKRKFN